MTIPHISNPRYLFHMYKYRYQDITSYREAYRSCFDMSCTFKIWSFVCMVCLLQDNSTQRPDRTSGTLDSIDFQLEQTGSRASSNTPLCTFSSLFFGISSTFCEFLCFSVCYHTLNGFLYVFISLIQWKYSIALLVGNSWFINDYDPVSEQYKTRIWRHRLDLYILYILFLLSFVLMTLKTVINNHIS